MIKEREDLKTENMSADEIARLRGIGEENLKNKKIAVRANNRAAAKTANNRIDSIGDQVRRNQHLLMAPSNASSSSEIWMRRPTPCTCVLSHAATLMTSPNQ